MAFRREKQGGDRIDALKSLELKGKLNVGSTKMEVTVLAAGPDRVVRRVVWPEGVVTAIFDGERVSGRQGPPTRGRSYGSARARRTNEPACAVARLARKLNAVRVAGKARMDGEDVGLRVECEFEPPLTRYVSMKSGLLKKEEGWITASGLGTVPISIRLDDFRDVAGVKVPFRSTAKAQSPASKLFN